MLYAKLIDEIKLYNPNSNFDLINKAYNLALEGHMQQKRASGETRPGRDRDRGGTA